MGISGRRIGHGGGGRRAHLEQGLLLARVRLEVEHLVNDDAEVEESVGHNRDEWELAVEGAVNGCQWGSSAGERRLSAGLTAKTKGLSITSDPRRATHATSATATPERTPCILFIPRARKPSCVINVPLNTNSKPALGCSGTPGFPDSQGGSVLVTCSEVLGGMWVFWRAQQPSLCGHPPRPSSIARCSPRSPCLRSRAPSPPLQL